MTNRKEPKWFTQWLPQREIEEEDAFCNDLLSKWMDAGTFISTVEVANLEVGKSSTEIVTFRDELWRAIETASTANEPWLRLHGRALDGGPLWRELDPRAAALWLLSKPMYQHLVPPTWARVVLRDAKPMPEETTRNAAASDKAVRPRGPKPELIERVTQEMREIEEREPGRLGRMLEKEMEEKFGAGRTTCRKARNRVLSES